MSALGRLAPWCLPCLLLGCQSLPGPYAPHPAELKAVRELETAALGVWGEDRPVFETVTPLSAARAWERNLRALKIKARRSGNIVEAETPEGYGFSLTFWESKDLNKGKTIGELTWHNPEDAGRGMESLLDVEKKRSTPGGSHKRGAPAQNVIGLLPAGTLTPDLNVPARPALVPFALPGASAPE